MPSEPDNEHASEAPKSDLEKVEEDILQKIEKKVELQKLEAESESELASIGKHGTMEQFFLMAAAVIMIFGLPFLHYLSGIVLTIFTVVVSLVAGLTSPKKAYSAELNLLVSVIGALIFEYSAINQFHTASFSLLFILDQALAFLFLFATYFSMRTYREKILEQ